MDVAGKVTFKMGKTVIEAPAKIETNASKFANTLLNTKSVNGQPQIKELDLGGTNSKIVFTDASVADAGTH